MFQLAIFKTVIFKIVNRCKIKKQYQIEHNKIINLIVKLKKMISQMYFE